MAERKNPLAMDPLFPDRPRILPRAHERKSGPLGMGILEEIPRPLRDIPRPIRDRTRLGER